MRNPQRAFPASKLALWGVVTVTGWAVSRAGVVAQPEGFGELLPGVPLGRQDRC